MLDKHLVEYLADILLVSKVFDLLSPKDTYALDCKEILYHHDHNRSQLDNLH